MADPAKGTGATYEDLAEVSDDLVAEITHGELWVTPRPAPKHARVASALGARLFGPFDEGERGPGGWWILDEPEVHFGADVLVPDLAGWRRERMADLPDSAWFEVVPDWVCEVISPRTARVDRDHKLPVYAANGVGHLWLIDPAPKSLEVYGQHKGGWILLQTFGQDDVVRAEPFDAVPLDLAILWR